jgi:hypothetical protein
MLPLRFLFKSGCNSEFSGNLYKEEELCLVARIVCSYHGYDLSKSGPRILFFQFYLEFQILFGCGRFFVLILGYGFS